MSIWKDLDTVINKAIEEGFSKDEITKMFSEKLNQSIEKRPNIAIHSGKYGECSWNIDKKGTLTISPTNGEEGMLENTNSTMPPWRSFAKEVKKVVVEQGVYANKSSESLFRDLKNCAEMDLSRLNTSGVINMRGMFAGCLSVKNLDLRNFDTRNVKNMCELFYGCKSLESVNLSTWKTLEVRDMAYMFASCSELQKLDLSNFNTGKVWDMSFMFDGCRNLSDLDISSFEAASLGRDFGMFSSCDNLHSLSKTSPKNAEQTKAWEPPKAKEKAKEKELAFEFS